MTGPDKADLSYLEKLKGLTGPEAHGFHALHQAAEGTDGAIRGKYRQLTMLAAALITQCLPCIESHAAKARETGATRHGVSEVSYMAAAVRVGRAVAHGLFALRCYETSGPLA